MGKQKHQHEIDTFSVNNEIRCLKCKDRSPEGQNECYCGCHKINQAPAEGNILRSCQKCSVFHNF